MGAYLTSLIPYPESSAAHVPAFAEPRNFGSPAFDLPLQAPPSTAQSFHIIDVFCQLSGCIYDGVIGNIM